MRRVLWSAALMAATLGATGCQGTPTILTSCPLALVQGTLVASGENLEIDVPGGSTQLVHWPDGVSVGRSDGTLALIGFFGQVIAREGDYIEMGGGEGADGVFKGCGEIRVTDGPS
jgi:hypothetical protein